MDISGYVVLGIVTLFLVYLMPQLIRGRQDVVDSRLADRFSADLRILATAGTSGGGSRPSVDDGAPRAYLHDPRLRTEVSAMNRPTTRVERPAISAPANPGETRGSNSQPQPALARRPQGSDASAPSGRPVGQRPGTSAPARGPIRPEVARRRRAAARRRLVLTLALLGLSAWAWVAFAAGAAHLALAVAPTALLAIVLVLGRRAAAAAARADRPGRRAPARENRPARPVTVAPQGSRPEVASSRGSARPAARPAGRDARAEHAGTSRVIAAQRQNVNAQRGQGQTGGAPAPHVPAAASVAEAAARQVAAGKAPRASRDAGTEIIPRIRPAEAGAVPVADDTSASGASQVPLARADVDAEAVSSDVSSETSSDVSSETSSDGAVAAARGSLGVEVADVEAPLDRSWTPVPVPVPTYTLKPAAPRMSPPELSAAEGGRQAPEVADADDASPVTETAEDASAAVQAATSSSASAAPEAPIAEAPTAEAPPTPVMAPARAASASGLDLNAVLSRRRASGE